MGLPRGLFLVGHAWNTSLDVEEQQLFNKLPLGDCVPPPISKGTASHPARKLISVTCIHDLALLVMTQVHDHR